MGKIWETIKYIFEGLIVVMEDYDTELWDNPRKKERIRRRWARERRKNGKKENG